MNVVRRSTSASSSAEMPCGRRRLLDDLLVDVDVPEGARRRGGRPRDRRHRGTREMQITRRDIAAPYVGAPGRQRRQGVSSWPSRSRHRANEEERHVRSRERGRHAGHTGRHDPREHARGHGDRPPRAGGLRLRVRSPEPAGVGGGLAQQAPWNRSTASGSPSHRWAGSRWRSRHPTSLESPTTT